MTLPLQFDTAQYIKTLTDAGISREQAEAHAEALKLAMSQPVANDSDLAILRAELHAMFAEHEAKMIALIDERLSAKLKPIYYWLGVLTVMQAITMTKVFL